MFSKLQLFIKVLEETLYAIIILTPPLFLIIFTAGLLAISYKRFFFSRTAHAFVMFCSFGLFGATVGLFIGASQVPVIGGALPPLITLVSSYILVSKTDKMPVKIRIMLPGAISMMLVILLFSAFFIRGFRGGDEQLLKTELLEPGK